MILDLHAVEAQVEIMRQKGLAFEGSIIQDLLDALRATRAAGDQLSDAIYRVQGDWSGTHVGDALDNICYVLARVSDK